MNQIKTSPVSTLLRAVLLSALASGSALSAIINPSFELGTTGWTESGGSGNFTTTATVDGFFHSINAAETSSLGIISNDGVAEDSISQTFPVGAGLQFLSFSYLFLTDGYNDPAFNDGATAILTPTVGSPVTLFSVSRDDLQAGGAGALLPGAQYFDFQTISQDAWRTATTDISAFAGQNVTLTFSVNNGGDPDFVLESRLAVDKISLSPVPEQGDFALLALFGGAGAVLRRKR